MKRSTRRRDKKLKTIKSRYAVSYREVFLICGAVWMALVLLSLAALLVIKWRWGL